MAGIPTESPLVLRESLGSSHNRLTFGLSARRSFGREVMYTMPNRKAYPGLNAGACAHHGVTRENALLLPAAIALGLLIQRRTSWSAPILASARTTYSPHK